MSEEKTATVSLTPRELQIICKALSNTAHNMGRFGLLQEAEELEVILQRLRAIRAVEFSS